MVLKFLQEEKWLKCIIEDILRHQSVSVSRLPLPLCLPGMFPLQISHFSLPWWLNGKESTRSAGDLDSIPGLERSSGEGNGNPLQYSCLGSPIDREAWSAIFHGVAKESDTTWVTKQQRFIIQIATQMLPLSEILSWSSSQSHNLNYIFWLYLHQINLCLIIYLFIHLECKLQEIKNLV